MILLLPCAGLSSRFGNRGPKWMQTHPSGRVMIQEAISKVAINHITEVRMIVCQDQLKDGITEQVLLEVLADAVPPGMDFKLDVLTLRTRSQAETVYASILTGNITGPIFVKDCDNQFRVVPQPFNGVATYEIGPSDDIRRLQQKSFVNVDDLGLITEVVEKRIVSQQFSVGGYSFESAQDFVTAFQACMAKPREGELFISEVIQWMIDRGERFTPIKVRDYEDWGTIEEWNAYKATFKTVICDLDGVLLNNSSQYLKPRWTESEPLLENIEALKRQAERTTLVLVTARPESARQATEDILKAAGIKWKALVMGLPHARRILVNDFNDATAPYPTAEAINLPRNDRRLGALLK